MSNINNMVGILDLETMDKFDDAIILSGGIVIADITKRIPFEKLITDEYSWFFKLDSVEQRNLGRSVCRHTIDKFWMNKEAVTEPARMMSFYPDKSRDFSCRDLPSKLNAQIERLAKGQRDNMSWGDRNSFDFWKINHLFDKTLDLGDGSSPFARGSIFEISTVMTHFGFDRYGGIGPWHYQTRGFVYHHPVHDSALDWLRYQAALESLGIIEVTDLE